VVYTQATRSGGLDLAVAARLAWCLAYCGVEHVSLFPGGTDAWTQAGLSAAPHPAAPVRAHFFEGAPDTGEEETFPMHPEYLASTAEVEAAVDAAGSAHGVQLVDVRSWGEYSGGGNDYKYPLPRGRIPGAHWGRWGPSTFVAGELYNHTTGTLHPITTTAALWRQRGIEIGSERRLLFYCGSGWRSAVAWCLAALLGHVDAANYDGGFLEWSLLSERAPVHPIVTCAPPEAAADEAAADAVDGDTVREGAVVPVGFTAGVTGDGEPVGAA